jgi:hypothetical protein
VSCEEPAALRAICVPAKARDRNMKVPMNSPMKALISVRIVWSCFRLLGAGVGEGSWRGNPSSGSLSWTPSLEIFVEGEFMLQYWKSRCSFVTQTMGDCGV